MLTACKVAFEAAVIHFTILLRRLKFSYQNIFFSMSSTRMRLHQIVNVIRWAYLLVPTESALQTLSNVHSFQKKMDILITWFSQKCRKCPDELRLMSKLEAVFSGRFNSKPLSIILAYSFVIVAQKFAIHNELRIWSICHGFLFIGPQANVSLMNFLPSGKLSTLVNHCRLFIQWFNFIV